MAHNIFLNPRENFRQATIKGGRTFRSWSEFNITALTFHDIVFSAPETIHAVEVYKLLIQAFEESLKLELYATPTWTGGTQLVGYNLAPGFDNSAVSLTEIYDAPTVTDTGTLIDVDYFAKSEIVGGGSTVRVGNAINTDLARIIPGSSSFLLRLHNEGNGTTKALMKFFYSEIIE